MNVKALTGLCLFAGWLGLLFYALATGLPILIQGFLGPIVQKRKPNLMSFTDFVKQVGSCTPKLHYMLDSSFTAQAARQITDMAVVLQLMTQFVTVLLSRSVMLGCS